MSEAQESHRALSLRDIAEDEVARERFRRRLDSYRDELKLLVSEMSGLLAVVNMNACEAGMSRRSCARRLIAFRVSGVCMRSVCGCLRLSRCSCTHC